MRCDACRHWNTKEDASAGWEGKEIGFHSCSAVHTRWDIQDSANAGTKDYPGDDDAGEVAWGKRRVEALRNARAYVQDGSEYFAELVTGPDFGCVLFDQADSSQG